MSKTFKIGSIELANRYVLAPMAGYTNHSLRTLVKEAGAGLTYTEMISATALMYGNHKTFDMLPRDKSEKPLALQLFGGDIDAVIKSIPIVEKEAVYDFLDFNMGCPVPKVMKQKAGSFWLKRTDEVYDLLHKMVQTSRKPVVIKIRAGFDSKNINALEIGKIAESAGVSAIALHARTRDEYYQGKPHYEIIKDLKETLSIPVIANGNIDLSNIDEVSDYTKADAFMIGRSCLGNPLIFRDFIDHEDGRDIKQRDAHEQLDLMTRHLNLLVEEMGEKNAVRYFRGLAVLYVKGFINAKNLKQALVSMETMEDYKRIIDDKDLVQFGIF